METRWKQLHSIIPCMVTSDEDLMDLGLFVNFVWWEVGLSSLMVWMYTSLSSVVPFNNHMIFKIIISYMISVFSLFEENFLCNNYIFLKIWVINNFPFFSVFSLRGSVLPIDRREESHIISCENQRICSITMLCDIIGSTRAVPSIISMIIPSELCALFLFLFFDVGITGENMSYKFFKTIEFVDGIDQHTTVLTDVTCS